MPDNKQIHEFAIKWMDKFRNQKTNFVELVDRWMAEDCHALGFKMDCGESFSEKYGAAVYDYVELNKIIDTVNDISLLGAAIYSRWRYFNHWAYSGEEIIEEKNRAWFILALSRLAVLTGENPFVFSGTLKKIRIVSNALGYGPMPEPDEEVEQHITINSEGMVWFSAYNYGGYLHKREQLRRQQFRIERNRVTNLFEAFEQYFSNGYETIFATDIGDWNLELTNTEGEIFKFRGSLCAEFYHKGNDLSDMVREAIDIRNLYVFDGKVASDIITRIIIDYHRVTKINPAERNLCRTYDSVVWDYTERLIIDRESNTLEHIRDIGTGCKVTRKYEVEDGIESLLENFEVDELFNEVEGNPEDVVENPNETRDYEITINYKWNSPRIVSGTFDKRGLPKGYENFIEEVLEFMMFYGMGEIFNASLYNKIKRRKNEYIFCSVEFDGGHKSYYYLTEDDTINVGDYVVVPVGKDNHESVAEVVKIEYFEENEAPYSVDRIKRIIGKYVED